MAGEIVNRTSKGDAASTRLVERGAGGLMDAIAYEVDVQDVGVNGHTPVYLTGFLLNVPFTFVCTSVVDRQH